MPHSLTYGINIGKYKISGQQNLKICKGENSNSISINYSEMERSEPFFSHTVLLIRVSMLQVVANIPFNISTDIVKQLLPMGDIFSEVVLLLQVHIFASVVHLWADYCICLCIMVLFSLIKFLSIGGSILNFVNSLHGLVMFGSYSLSFSDHATTKTGLRG